MANDLDTLLQQFLRERKYLRNVSPDTIDWYECAWKAFRGSATSCLTDPAALRRSDLEQFVYALRDRGVKPVTCNTWLRAKCVLPVASRERPCSRADSHAPTEGREATRADA